VSAGRYSEKGFKAEYVGKVLGLLPSALLTEVHPHGAEVVRWAERRRMQFNPHLRPAPTGTPQEIAASGNWTAAVDAALRGGR
jgi:hypothetical protein